MIGFSAGQENLHGVQAVLKGRRCALAMWFTLDHKHRERERFLALQVLDQLDVEGMTKTTNQQDDNVKYKNYNEEITISKNDELEDPSDSQDFEIPRSEWSEMNTFQLTTSHGFSDSTYDREEL